ncbi:uncharacterized protein LOC133502698 [Syngnathoides biaculeatus]|uniref:uncharacterized protein LOC133502698 n=1 Tax=Syngnathoides biaculeatus TaxID=300417 RepID=UPI002ADE1528|nr:uncharacterized protein LOC133502698 [Syngnathoides biaculeatus]
MYGVTLLAIVLSGFLAMFPADKDACDLHAAVGQTMALPFVYKHLTNADVLSWTHNGTVVFNREDARVSVGKPEDVSKTGSLLLRNLKLSGGGLYQATVRHPNRTLMTVWTGRLCTTDKVSRPRLSYVCDLEIGFVNLSCDVDNPQNLSFSWTVDDVNLSDATKQTLNVSLDKVKKFACGVRNRFSTERSQTLDPVCKTSIPTSPTSPAVLLCLTSETIVALLAGLAAVFLLLLVVLVVLCQRRRRGKSDVRASGKADLRMCSVKRLSSPDYETMNPTDFLTLAFPEPLPRTCHASASTLDQAAATNPSPVPKPRTKNPRTQDASSALKSSH